MKAAKFDEKFRSLVTAVASIIFIPLMIMNESTKKDPVPGPKNPS